MKDQIANSSRGKCLCRCKDPAAHDRKRHDHAIRHGRSERLLFLDQRRDGCLLRRGDGVLCLAADDIRRHPQHVELLQHRFCEAVDAKPVCVVAQRLNGVKEFVRMSQRADEIRMAIHKDAAVIMRFVTVGEVYDTVQKIIHGNVVQKFQHILSCGGLLLVFI